MTVDPAQNPYTAGQSDTGEVHAAQAIKGGIRTGQIITFALVQGVVVITAIMAYLVVSGAEDGQALFQTTGESLTNLIIGAVLAVVAIGVCLAIRMVMRNQSMSRFQPLKKPFRLQDSKNSNVPGTISNLIGAYHTRNLVGQAVLEGATVINAMLIMLSDNLMHLVPIAVLLVGIVLQVPTLGKVKQWIEDAQLP